MARHPATSVRYVVFSGDDERSREARASAAALSGLSVDIHVLDFKDGLFPAQQPAIKSVFEQFKADYEPDVILTHHTLDLHQDHATIGAMTRQTFRDHLILRYEIPKYDADLGGANAYFPLTERVARQKARHIHEHFASQRGRRWFDPETFLSLARLRGIECNAAEGFAEAFHLPKATIAI